MSSSTNSNIKSLHIIRGLCAFLVVVYHAKFILWSGGTLYLSEKGLTGFMDYIMFGIDMLSSCGNQCVLLFFILSGFVIYHSFNDSNKKLDQFYIIRVIRIYIPYLFSLCFAIAALVLVVKLNGNVAVSGIREYNSRLLIAYNDLDFTTILKTLVFIKSKEYAGFNFAYWSLLHESVFYLMFPVYYYIGVRFRIFIFMLYIVCYYFLKADILYYQLYFLFGMFLYDYYKTERKLIVPKYYYPFILVLFFLGANFFVKIDQSYLADISAAAMTLFAFDYIILQGIRKNKYLMTLSDMSYSLYLNHLTILMICYALYNTWCNKLVFFERYPYYMGVVLSLLGCYVIYFFVEKKSLFLITKIKEKWN